MANPSHRKTMLLVAAVFILPVALAKLALEMDWFSRASTNKGVLLEPIPNLANLDSQHKWRLLYVLPSRCDAACENALVAINQVWVALGREQDRAEPLVIVMADSDAKPRQHLSEFPGIRMMQASQQDVNEVFKDVPTDGIFLVDTMDNVVLRYPPQIEQQQAVLHSRDILADLRKLLKLSRIG